MAGWRMPGPVCQIDNWINVTDGTTAVTATPAPGTVQADAESPGHLLAGVSGKIDGVGPDIVAYLRAVGEFFDIHIVVTSGKRDADAQANAMYDNWLKLERGAVYATAALSLKNRQAMDNYYKIAEESDTATDADAALAKKKFLEIGRTVRSRHSSGRATDILLNSLTPQARQAILMRMKEVKEGKRKDIIHVESLTQIPAVDAALEARWQNLLHPRTRHVVEKYALNDGANREECIA